MIRFEEIRKVWADGTVALDDITLSIPRGQFCVVLGHSGAGKSTLLRTVNALVHASSGQVWVGDVALNTRTQQALRPKVAMVHQHFNLSTRLSVAANVLAGVLPVMPLHRALSGWFPKDLREKACAALQDVGLEPHHLRRRAGELSGGQQQRVGIARAFMLDPEVVLADEPVASLDPKISRDIMTLLRRTAMARGSTVLCSLHQVDLACEFADRIVGMRHGRVVFDLTPAELNSDRISALYRHDTPAEPAPVEVAEPEGWALQRA